MTPSPALIVIGGFAGTGKTAVSRRLSSDLRIPRLGSDTIGRAITGSAGLKCLDVDAYWIAYDVLFRLCADFIAAGISAILEVTMGWEFQWREVDSILRRRPQTRFLPIILRCPLDTCIERIRKRHAANPTYYDAADVYLREPKLAAIWDYLARLKRPAVRFIDADRPSDEVYADMREYVSGQLTIDPHGPQGQTGASALG